MQAYRLPRTGAPPLTFTGELIYESTSAPEIGPKRKDGRPQPERSHELRVYRTQAGSLIAQVSYRTTWDEEHERDDVYNGTPAAIADALARHDPTQAIVGYPPGAQFEARQQRLLIWHQEAYAALVSEVLGMVPECAQEVP